MSINVTVSGNPINIRRGRMVLTDLDQIKRNERERRRRLRLEQVRQQSKEISNRILERAKKIARQELNKLEKDGQSELKRMHDRKIMEIQQKYQEDMEDIGQAHAAAASLPDMQAALEEERRKNRLAALKRGQEAIEQQVRELEKKDDLHAARQERLRQVREMENLRSSMISNLPPKSPAKEQEPKTSVSVPEQESSNEDDRRISPKKRKAKRTPKKSPGKVAKSNVKVISSGQKIKTPQRIAQKQKQPKFPKFRSVARKVIAVADVHEPPKVIAEEVERIEELGEFESDDETPRKTMPGPCVTPSKAEKVARYNPEDYTHEPGDSNSSSSSSTSASDDSSYFSDSAEQSNYSRLSKPASRSSSKVHFYDHSTRQRNTYERPAGIVERVDVRNEPNAMDEAERVQRAESVKAQLIETRRMNAQRRGEDAILRERVRRDYQALMQNLDHLTREERKLKAAQVQCNLDEDVHLRGNMRKEYLAERQSKMERAFREILDCSAPPKKECPHFTERVITLPRRAEEPEEEKLPEWQYPPFPPLRKENTKIPEACESQEELSREEQILEMLKKVERQKRLLLQEFGASLPENILNGSLKSLVGKESSTRKPCGQAPPPSPDIKVINMSSCDEKQSSGKSKKSADEKSADVSRRSSDTRRRVVTKRITTLRRKVASPLKKSEIAVQTTEVERPATEARDKSVQVELRVESRETSESVDTSFGAPAGYHPLEPKVTVITPQVDESSSGSSTSIITGLVIDIDKDEVKVTPRKKKSSLQVAKRSTPKFFKKSRSTPSSKASSPAKKKSSRSLPASRASSPKKASSGRTINIQVSRNGFNVKVDPSETTEFASSEKAELLIGQESHGGGSSRVPEAYRIQSRSRRSIRIRDTSEDTSTSFASPPPVRPGSMINALTNSTPILELLDSSANESARVSRREVSPVSTPETPSPRTMMMPSNVLHPERLGRMLRYGSNDSPNDSTLPSSIGTHDRTTSTDPPESLRAEGSAQREVCSCRNPECKLVHMKIEEAHEYAARNCPEILRKYEDLQNMCTERIASLTDLIEKVRSDQKGLDFSMVSSRDETKLMDLPPAVSRGGGGVRDDLQSVRRLVENIEAIHNQLARTLFESQRIITSEPVGLTAETSTNIPENVPRETVGTSTSPESGARRAKPTIISDERVSVQLNRFQTNRKPQTMFLSTPERSSWPPARARREEDVISKLSREILEQSKEESSKAAKVSKSFLTKLKVSPPKGLEESKEDEEKEPELEDKRKDFVPLLAGIPKIPRGSASSSGARPKPPVTILNGPYKTDLDSPVHELSTIIEFDTPDTGSRSHGARSPTSKRILAGNAGGFRSPREAKPSVHVAPFPVEESRRVSSPTKLSSQVAGESAPGSEKPAESSDAPEKSNKELQCEEEKETPQLDISINTGTTKYKEKVTSTSSNSFSGLSGVSEITSTPSSDILKYASSPEEMETALKKLGLGWAIATLKKTREASALSSSSNSDLTPLNTARKLISPVKNPANPLPDLSDLSSISIKEASKSTERAVLLKGRTSTPNMHDLNSNSGRSQCTTSSESFSFVASNRANL